MIEINDILKMVNLADGSEQTKKFREFIENEKWSIDLIKNWLDECVNDSKGSQDPYHKAFQDLVISLGGRLGFELEYGRYVGKQGQENYDGIWKKSSGETIVLEIKSTTWPIASIAQLGGYIDKRMKQEENDNIFGVYVTGRGDQQPLIEQILGSKYRERMRVINKDDLIKLVNLKEELEPVIGEQKAIEKIQQVLLPLESINVGNIINLIVELAATKEPPATKEPSEAPPEIKEKLKEPWLKHELQAYLNESTTYQRILLTALTQVEQEPAPMKKVLYIMNEIAKRRSDYGIEKEITGSSIAGARAGMTMRRNSLGKEDILDAKWESKINDYVFNIKPDYKQIVINWVQENGLS